MSAQLLLDESLWLRAAAFALILMPAAFILFSRRSSWWSKLLWIAGCQAGWGFALLFTWVWRQRYADAAPRPSMHLLGQDVLIDAIGWWTFAFPWAVYLLYRGTRSWFPGESRAAASKDLTPPS